MAQSTYVRTAEVDVYRFTQYSSTLSAFQTAVDADFPELGGTELLATTAAPTVAILIVPGGPTLTINPTDWLGINKGQWQVFPDSAMDGSTFTAFTPA